MNYLRFLRFRLAAWRNDDAYLARGTSAPEALFAEVAGKRVAIVGNARALSHTEQGPDIDACDIVIRINRAPMPDVKSHGSQTDWLALATSLNQESFDKLGASRLIWMSHKRKRLRMWMAQTSGFVLFPNARYSALKSALGAQPTTGAMLIDFISKSDAAEVHLFGFDFFASMSLSGKRDSASVPHNFTSESGFVQDLVETDPRFTLHPMK
ncbi:glycosyl transferase family 29 (putative sialyltransferase) [Pacificibacter maritimus]|uniref:Glycosyl transferase family 29 (Putative sialyltransferase) n=1 Tax=Pacificibacter maritimus TaxID=762213 RepID=A0A3N4U839_9RHOB|nr:glycosyltransferase family 29 protein [Pacificibacter maritimus]RPE63129.1 glycosyl transferase family 29 (putative sialyltransferase) [Pacificibacter maritimus]